MLILMAIKHIYSIRNTVLFSECFHFIIIDVNPTILNDDPHPKI